jgi:hypothetical protein
MSVDLAARNIAVTAVAAVAVQVALHAGDPGTGAANELSGAGYARQSVAWNAASDGVVEMSTPLVFDVPAETITWATVWDEAGTTRYGKAQLDSPAVFPVPGVFYLNAAVIDFAEGA